MNAESQILPKPASVPMVVHPGPVVIEDILRYVDPAPDSETESFVAAIYADRDSAVGLADK